jgi:hypothetical protein
MSERSYGESRPAAESLPPTGVPETEDEAAERSQAQAEEDTLAQDQAQDESEDEDDSGL